MLLDRRYFALAADEFKRFKAVLDRPPKDNPRLRRPSKPDLRGNDEGRRQRNRLTGKVTRGSASRSRYLGEGQWKAGSGTFEPTRQDSGARCHDPWRQE